jgi:methyl acetate hydrolase
MNRLLAGFPLVVLLALLPLHAAPSAPVVSARGASDLTAYLQGAVDRQDIPGAVALVVNRDRVVYHEAFGKLNEKNNVPMPKDAIFNIASMTKPVTSVAIMMLVEEGKIRLDDEASKYLPSLASLPVLAAVDVKGGTYATKPARRPITIRQLLTHTSGIGYGFSDAGVALAQQKLRAQDGEAPLVHEPGARWTYGASTKVLGDIIVRITGRPLDQYVAARILQPLGMTDTSYAVPAAKRARVVTVHSRVDGRWVEAANSDAPPPVTIRGDGGLYSTASDYALFIRALLNGGTLGQALLIRPQTLRDMTRNQIGSLVVPLQPSTNLALSKPFPLGAGRDKWGLGFQLATTRDRKARSVGSYSWAGIYNTEFWVDPQKRIGAVLMMQALPFYDEKAIETLKGFEQRVYAGLAAE